MSKNTPSDDAAAAVTHTEQPLTGFELPEYHGRKPSGMKSSLNGSSNRLTRPHDLGERVVLVVEGIVTEAGHKETDGDGLTYAEKVKVLDVFDINGDPGKRLLTTVRSLHRTSADTVSGKTALAAAGVDLTEAGYTDASGVVLLPSELAELRGDPLRAMVSPALTPAVIVYDSGTRMVWPDEYDTDEHRPRVGQAHPDDHEDGVDADRVSKVLHHETGEPIEDPIPPTATSLHSVPALPGEDDDDQDDDGGPFDGDLGDDVPDLGARLDGPDLGDGVPDLGDEVPDDEASIEAAAMAVDPGPADFAVVDCTISELRTRVDGYGDRILLTRLRKAEEAGRGRGLQVRAGALAVIDAQLEKVSG